MRKVLRKRRRMVAISTVTLPVASASFRAASEAGEELVEPDADGGDEAERDASARHLVEKKGSGSGEEQVGSPDSKNGRELAILGEGDADLRKEVVDEDKNDGENEAGGLASALGGDAERNADEHEDKAGEGIGEAPVELDAIEAGGIGQGCRCQARCRVARVRRAEARG